MKTHPARPATAPDSAKVVSFVPTTLIPIAAAVRSFSRTAAMAPPSRPRGACPAASIATPSARSAARENPRAPGGRPRHPPAPPDGGKKQGRGRPRPQQQVEPPRGEQPRHGPPSRRTRRRRLPGAPGAPGAPPLSEQDDEDETEQNGVDDA